MIKENDKVKIKDTSDVVSLGWYNKGEIVKVIGIMPIKGKKHDKLYFIANDDDLRLGVYEEDIEEVVE